MCDVDLVTQMKETKEVEYILAYERGRESQRNDIVNEIRLMEKFAGDNEWGAGWTAAMNHIKKYLGEDDE